MLEVSHVTKKYRNTVACQDLSFTLDDGTVTVLLGQKKEKHSHF